MVSTYIQEHNRLFGDLTAALGRDLAHLSSEANGGRSILFVYPPVDEEKYIEEAKQRYTDGYEFIDLRQLLVEFVDSKGIRNLKGFQDPKIQLYKTLKEEVEPTLHDADITIDSYIISNTAYQDVKFWGTRPEFAEDHVLFDEDEKYIETLFKRIVSN